MDPFTATKSPVSKRSKSRLRTITWAASACLCVLALLGVFALVTKDDELIELARYSVWARGGLVPRQPRLEKAIAILSGPSNVVGTVTFFQPKGRGPVTVHGTIKNLDPNALRGFHVHGAGDLGNGCLNAGPHYNPFNKTHGAPTDAIRHVGDLGNVGSNDVGIADFTIKDKQLTLNGPLSILGRAVVVHAGTDDLGKGGNEESLKTGNAGARLACGVIGISA